MSLTDESGYFAKAIVDTGPDVFAHDSRPFEWSKLELFCDALQLPTEPVWLERSGGVPSGMDFSQAFWSGINEDHQKYGFYRSLARFDPTGLVGRIVPCYGSAGHTRQNTAGADFVVFSDESSGGDYHSTLWLLTPAAFAACEIFPVAGCLTEGQARVSDYNGVKTRCEYEYKMRHAYATAQ